MATNEFGQTMTAARSTTTSDILAPALGENAPAATPDRKSPAYLRMEPRWTLCRTLMGGTDAVRDAGEDMIPALEGEEQGDYDARATACALTNAFKRTVQASVGLLMQRPPKLGDDMPQGLVTLAENIDASGTGFARFVEQLALDAMIDGHAGILVDYQRPDSPGVDLSNASAAAGEAIKNKTELDAADEAGLGLRAYWVGFRASDIFLTIYSIINGQKTLVLLVLREITEELIGDTGFGVQSVVRYRVYRRSGKTVTCEVWKAMPPSGTAPEVERAEETITNQTAIPFVKVVAGDVISITETRPPLLDLAHLNVEHHQVKSNMRNLENLALVPTLVRTGYVAPVNKDTREPEPAPVLYGPKQVIDVPIGGTVAWLTPDTKVLDPAARSLADLKADMGAAGLAFLAPDTRRAETAEAKRIDAGAQNATLATFGGNLEDGLELAWQFTGLFTGEKSGSVSVNREFESLVMDPATITALGNLAANGQLSIDTLLALLERGRVLGEGFDREAELEKILKQNSTPPNPPGDPNGTTPKPGDVATGDNIKPGDLGAAA